MSNVTVGILSFAHQHAEAYTEALLKMNGVDLVGFTDGNRKRAASVESRFGLKSFTDPAQLLGQSLDAVIVCSENVYHRQHVDAALAAGSHVLCEKPLATNSANAAAMVQAATRANRLLRTAFPMRFSTPVRRMKNLITAGQIGELRVIEGTNQGQIPTGHRHWFVDPVLAGGGAIIDHTAHLADAMRWLTGDEVAEVYAQTVTTPPLTVETGGLIILRFQRGLVATIDCSWSRPQAFPIWGGFAMHIGSEKAIIALDAFAERVSRWDDRSGSETWIDYGHDSNAAMLVEFLEAVRGRGTPSTSSADGLRAAEIVDAAYASVRSGKPNAVQLTPLYESDPKE